MNEMLLTVQGNVVSDVAYRVTDRGLPHARFRIASSARRYDRSTARWVDGDTTYFDVQCWRRSAENARDSLAKGHPVVVHGRLRVRRVDRELSDSPGQVRSVTFTDLEAYSFGLDLSRCRSRYERSPIGPQTHAEEPAEGDGKP